MTAQTILAPPQFPGVLEGCDSRQFSDHFSLNINSIYGANCPNDISLSIFEGRPVGHYIVLLVIAVIASQYDDNERCLVAKDHLRVFAGGVACLAMAEFPYRQV
jgi:hypothetical protein